MSISSDTAIVVVSAFLGVLLIAKVLEWLTRLWINRRVSRAQSYLLDRHQTHFLECRGAEAVRRELVTGGSVLVCGRCGEPLSWA